MHARGDAREELLPVAAVAWERRHREPSICWDAGPMGDAAVAWAGEGGDLRLDWRLRAGEHPPPVRSPVTASLSLSKVVFG